VEADVEPEAILMLPVWYAVFLLSATCHEAAHAWVALLGGDRTAYLGGQVSLNPLPHLLREPFGTLVVPLISYFLYASAGNRWMLGWASAPYDPAWEERHPRRAAVMALGGPLANLLLTLIALLVLRLGLEQGVWVQPQAIEFDRLVSAQTGSIWNGIGRFFSVLFTLNLVLAILNLIPLPPLDGASVLAGLARPFRMLRAQFLTSPIAGLVGLLVAWRVFPYVFRPIYRAAVLGWIYG
jgi:Zn-dependent protease